jgi:hypothetical protein
MPTAAAAKGDGDWGAWAPAWLDAWSLIAHCDFWDRHWMALFSRLAKHDTRSARPPSKHVQHCACKLSQTASQVAPAATI